MATRVFSESNSTVDKNIVATATRASPGHAVNQSAGFSGSGKLKGDIRVLYQDKLREGGRGGVSNGAKRF